MPDAFNGLVILMLAGIPILALFGILGSLAARRGGTRVWLDESLSRARRHKVWPPDLPSSGLVSPTQNKARLVWLTMLAIVIMGALVASVAVMIAVSKAAGALLLVAAFFLISRLSQGVLARHPSDCWSLPHHGT